MADFEFQKTGTTTLAIKCKDGVIIGADKRSTAGGMVVKRDSEKLAFIKDDIMLARAGTVSDLQQFIKIITAEVKLRELKISRPVLVEEVSTMMGNQAYRSIRTPSTITPITAFIVAGRDNKGFSIFDISPDGVVNEETQFISSGSGSIFALSVLEDSYKPDITVKEGVELAKRAFNIAMLKDTASGNGFKIYSITDAGTTKEADVIVNTGIAK